VDVSQIRTVLSSPPVASQLPCRRPTRRERQFRPPRFHGAADRPV